jgi:hypothetical protein
MDWVTCLIASTQGSIKWFGMKNKPSQLNFLTCLNVSKGPLQGLALFGMKNLPTWMTVGSWFEIMGGYSLRYLSGVVFMKQFRPKFTKKLRKGQMQIDK